MLEDLRGPATWRLHTRLCNFVRNISTSISTSGQRTHLKLGELSSLFILYNITIFWLYPMHGFWFYFLLRDNAHALLQSTLFGTSRPFTGQNTRTSERVPAGRQILLHAIYLLIDDTTTLSLTSFAQLLDLSRSRKYLATFQLLVHSYGWRCYLLWRLAHQGSKLSDLLH